MTTPDLIAARARNAARGAVWSLLDDALDASEGADDEDLDEAISSVADDASDDWGADGYRTQAVAGSAVRGAMGAGADAALRDPDTIERFPLWMFSNPDDSSTSLICAALTEPSVVLPAGHPWWDSHTPPLHHGCRSWITPLPAGAADVTGPRDVAADDGFGSVGGFWGWEPVETDYDVNGSGNAGPRGTGEPVEWGE